MDKKEMLKNIISNTKKIEVTMEEKIWNKVLGYHMCAIKCFTYLSASCLIIDSSYGTKVFEYFIKEEKESMEKLKKYMDKNEIKQNPEEEKEEYMIYENKEQIIKYAYDYIKKMKEYYKDVALALRNEANPYADKFFNCYLSKAEDFMDKAIIMNKDKDFYGVLPMCGCEIKTI